MERKKLKSSNGIKHKCGSCGYRLFDIFTVEDEVHITCHKCSGIAMRMGNRKKASEEMTPEQMEKYNEAMKQEVKDVSKNKESN